MEKPHGWTIWLTGLPAPGKTELAHALRSKLCQYGVAAVLLDSDELRRLVLANPAYSPAERDWFYDRLVELASWLTTAGDNVIITATGCRRAYREAARARLAPDFAEVWVCRSSDVGRDRDKEALYIIANSPGADAPYEPPEAPEMVVDTDRLATEAAADLVVHSLPFLLGAALVVG